MFGGALLLSKSKIKRDALQKSGLFTSIDTVSVPSSIEQPVEPYGLVCARLRMQAFAGSTDGYDAVVSVESSIDLRTHTDVVHVLVMMVSGPEIIWYTRSVEGIPFKPLWVDQLGERRTLGYDRTVGQVSGEPDEKNWMLTHCGMDRTLQITSVLKTPFQHSFSASLNYHVDFPKPGVVFKDISPLYVMPALTEFIRACTKCIGDTDQITHVVGIELRGIDLGAFLAAQLGATFIRARKRGKLPPPVVCEEYGTEYSTDALEMSATASFHGCRRVLMVDDLIATGGSMLAAVKLVRRVAPSTAPVTCFAPAYVESMWLGAKKRLKKQENVTCATLKM